MPEFRIRHYGQVRVFYRISLKTRSLSILKEPVLSTKILKLKRNKFSTVSLRIQRDSTVSYRDSMGSIEI